MKAVAMVRLREQFATFSNYGLVQVEFWNYEFWITFGPRFWKQNPCLLDNTVVIRKIESIPMA